MLEVCAVVDCSR